jgi:hypothetical protein
MSCDSTGARKLVIAVALAASATALKGTHATAQESARLIPKDDDRAKRLEQTRQLARGFKVVAIEGNDRTPLQLAAGPLHRWTDPTRRNSDGILWAWRSSGRPLALLAIEPQPTVWSFEFVSLSTGRVAAANGRVCWEPASAGVQFRDVPDAPAPADGPAERLRQMRAIAKRFSANEFWSVTGIRYTLRLLPQPIDRYSDADVGVIDGAIFVFANTTNPEIILLIEARRHDGAPATWSYAAAPLTTAAPVLTLDHKEVWKSDSKSGYLSGEPYFFGDWNRDRPAQ